MQWSVRPFVRIVIFFILGIIAGDRLYFLKIDYVPALLFFIILLILSLLLAKFFSSYSKRWIAAAVIYCLVFVAGFLNIYFRNKPLYNYTDEKSEKLYVGEIVSDAVFTRNAIRFEINLQSIDTLQKSKNEKILAYLEISDNSAELIYGDKIILNAKPNIFQNKGNPSEFDYKQFLLHSGIVKSVYLKNKNWAYLKFDPSNRLIAYARNLRRNLLAQLKAYMIFDNTYPVAAAILVGYDTLMDDETENNYVKAGVMHILCVSGLHVGVIFLLMSFLLRFLLASSYGRILRIVLLLASIWAYALLTGMSPSVERSAIMFSFFVIGQGMRRPKDSYNTIAASAFVMLSINPNLIFGVGFQLSYSAVLGIIAIYKPVYKLLYFKSKFLNYFWSILSVSIAAQLSTFPIASHYFHYFANYFWAINLIVIPASFAIIISGFVFFVFHWIPYLSGILGALTSALVWCINNVVALVDQLPFYGFNNIYMPWWKSILIYLLIVMLFHILFFKRIKLLIYLMSIFLILVSTSTIQNFSRLNSSSITYYNNNKHDIIQFTKANQSVVFSDADFVNDTKTQDYILKSSLIENGIKQNDVLKLGGKYLSNDMNLYSDGNFLQYYDKKYLIVDNPDSLKSNNLTTKLTFNTIIIHGRRKIDLHSLLDNFSFNNVIISPTVPYWKQKQLIEQCNDIGIEYFSIKNNGAWIENTQ